MPDTIIRFATDGETAPVSITGDGTGENGVNCRFTMNAYGQCECVSDLPALVTAAVITQEESDAFVATADKIRDHLRTSKNLDPP